MTQIKDMQTKLKIWLNVKLFDGRGGSLGLGDLVWPSPQLHSRPRPLTGVMQRYNNVQVLSMAIEVSMCRITNAANTKSCQYATSELATFSNSQLIT
jgi:hypothetical protein